MRVVPIGVGSNEKAAGVVAAYPDAFRALVVDVGCRARQLAAALPDGVAYVGVDIARTGHVVADVAAGLPLRTGSAGTVVALDVLEHTDDIHGAFDELCRVAAEAVVVSLPNVYDVQGRMAHLLGRPLSGKYGLPVEPVVDRHRWIFSFDEARRFCRTRGEMNGWRLVGEGALVGPRRRRLAPLVERWPDVLAPTYLAVLRR